jgi:hypothetical protein
VLLKALARLRVSLSIRLSAPRGTVVFATIAWGWRALTAAGWRVVAWRRPLPALISATTPLSLSLTLSFSLTLAGTLTICGGGRGTVSVGVAALFFVHQIIADHERHSIFPEHVGVLCSQ